MQRRQLRRALTRSPTLCVKWQAPAYSLMQAHLVLRKRQELNRQSRACTLQLLTPTLPVVTAYYRQRFCLFSLPEFATLLLTIAEPARTKLLDKLRRMEKKLYSLLKRPGRRRHEPGIVDGSLPPCLAQIPASHPRVALEWCRSAPQRLPFSVNQPHFFPCRLQAPSILPPLSEPQTRHNCY